MNERIRKLAEQVGYKSTRWDTTEQFEQFLDEFAELIVRECMDAIYDIDDLGGYHFKAANAVKQHFGVKE